MKLNIVLLVLATSLISQPLLADDVYNFYFQKGPEEEVVIDEGDMDEVDRAAQLYDDEGYDYVEEGENNTEITGPYMEPERISVAEPPIQRWGIRIGSANIGHEDSVADASGMSIGGVIRLNKYVDVDFEALFPSSSEYHYYESSFQNDPYVKKKFTRPEYSLGVGVTPFHIWLFGRETLRVAFLVGLMQGNPELDDPFQETRFSTFFGTRLVWLVSQHWSLEIDGRSDSSGISHSTLSVGYNF